MGSTNSKKKYTILKDRTRTVFSGQNIITYAKYREKKTRSNSKLVEDQNRNQNTVPVSSDLSGTN